MKHSWRHRHKLQFLVLTAILIGVECIPATPGDAHSEQWTAGDIVFLNGKSLRSKVVRLLEGYSTDYSHVGIVVVENGVKYVVNADPADDKVVKQRWNVVVQADEVSGGAIFRVAGANATAITIACATAESYANAGVPFDHDFNIKTPDKLFCTELVLRAYRRAGIDLCPDAEINHPHLLPADLLRSPALRQVLRF